MLIKGHEARDRDCPKRECWSPGTYQHRGASGAGQGSHNTGHYTKCCMHRAYHGCPADTEEPIKKGRGL